MATKAKQKTFANLCLGILEIGRRYWLLIWITASKRKNGPRFTPAKLEVV
jgi:hypothetical protein